MRMARASAPSSDAQARADQAPEADKFQRRGKRQTKNEGFLKTLCYNNNAGDAVQKKRQARRSKNGFPCNSEHDDMKKAWM